MTTVYLVAQTDDMTGILGLAIEGLSQSQGETNSASEGALIAHDLIEHVNGIKAIGSIDDELEALGAIWYVRGQWGDLTRNAVRSMYSVEENIASDVTRMFRDHVDGGQHVSYVNLNSKPVQADDYLQTILECADKTYLGEFNNDEDERTKAVEAWAAYRTVALKRMRRGYAKARRRWEKHGHYAANNRFWSIAEAVEPYCKPEYEGQRFKLSYDKNGACCDEVYAEDY